MITIDKNFTMPREWIKQQRDKLRNEVYPFARMKVGDIFLTNLKDIPSPDNFRLLVYREGRRLGFKFATRKDSKGNICVWRIA